VNLLFFTVELERNGTVDRPSSRGATPDSRPRPSRFHWIGLAMAVLICVAAAGCGGWFLAGGDPLVDVVPDWLALGNGSDLAGAGDQAWLEITSEPDGAAVFVDSHQKGNSPLFLAVSKTTHTLVLKHPEAVDDRRQVAVSTDMDVSVSMWRRRPAAVQLRPTYPGANISDAVFLADGRLALSMALPVQASGRGAGALREAWIFDPASGSLEPFNATGAIPRAAVVAVSPDGRRVAYLLGEQSEMRRGGAGPRLTELWVAGSGVGRPPVRVLALPPTDDPAARGSPPAEVEALDDMAWTPDGAHLLLTVQLVGVSGGFPAAPRSRLLLVDAPVGNSAVPASPIELVTLPARVLRGSYTWAPDGDWVAFLTQANGGPSNADFVALCAVDTCAGGAVIGFRYVADIAPKTDAASLLPVGRVAWAPVPDGRLVYTAATPKITVSNPLGLPNSSGGDPDLFLATPAGPALSAEEGRRLGRATGLIAPVWRGTADQGESGLLALSRSEQGSKPLIVRSIDIGDGTARDFGIELPPTVSSSGAVAARWDLPHGRLLIVAHPYGASAGVLEYWLVQLQARQGVD
jgi:hypothetical protein